jgi:hypothetical protein
VANLLENPSLTRRAMLRMLPWSAAFCSMDLEGAQTLSRHRVIVSTDVGGTDPDDFQSLVHLLLYGDALDLEGLIASPYGPGRLKHILEVIDHYEKDYPHLKSWSERYPSPAILREISKQGAIDDPGFSGLGKSTEGSEWIIRCARRSDPRPLYVLVWGGIEDLAQALHDAPDILPKLRVYFIGGPNKMWSVNAYNYVETQHPKLWMIESNATYRGWFVGGDQSRDRGNQSFVTAHVAGRGALGDYFATHLRGVIKMGDTPSVAYMLHGDPSDPSQPSWGGRYVPIWDDRKTVFPRLTTATDKAEVFGVVEFALTLPQSASQDSKARMIFDGRIPAVGAREGNAFRFRFSPRDAKVWPYVLESDIPDWDGQRGAFTAVPPPVDRTSCPSKVHPQWWIDDPDPAAAEGIHPGARSVNQWRAEFLRDFAERMERCRRPKG